MTAPAREVRVEPLIPRPSTRGGRRPRPARRGWANPIGWVALAAACSAYFLLLLVGFTSLLGVLLLTVAMIALLPWLGRVGNGAVTYDLAGLLRFSLALKLIATLPRYNARDDSVVYHRAGSLLADHFRALDFNVDTGRSVPGTGAVRYLTGLVEVITFEDEFATFLMFSLFGFVGIVWCVQAFRTALPDVDSRRYACLVLLWPSLLYWPSSVGKEAVVLLALGGSARGIALLLRGRRWGFAWLVAGLAAVVMIRPHVGLIVVIAAVSAFVIRGGKGSRGGSILARLVIVAALVFLGSIAIAAMERVLDVDGLDPTGVEAALDLAESRSSQGGSSFESARIDGILEYPWGFVTVLFRPFPYEAPSITTLLTAVEGAVLAGLLIAAVPRMAAAVRTVRHESYTVYCAVYVTVFVYLFSALANFGILARQRTTAVPFLLVLIALPTAQDRFRSRRIEARA